MVDQRFPNRQRDIADDLLGGEGDATEPETGALAGGRFELRPDRGATSQRLDKFVASALPELSRSYVQQLIEAGRVGVDGVVRRAAFKMTPGEVVTVDIPPPVPEELVPEPIPLDVVYEDADVIVLDKAAGMVVHPAPGHATGTLVNALLAHDPAMAVNGSNRPGIVHRLDKDTSGLMVIAKTDRARLSLVAQWNDRTVEKGYVALVNGVVEPNTATVDAPIGRDAVHRQRMAVTPKGRPAVTHLTVRQRFEATTLLDLEIETGRTHQIRVHLAFIHHPVVGDAVYGRARSEIVGPDGLALTVPRQFLHASRLAFDLPTGRRVAFASPLPPDLADLVRDLRGGAVWVSEGR